MDEMIPFLRAVAENPGDDAPRLVFADWLNENGHPERAEFIRTQVDLARMDPTDEGYVEATARMYRCGVLTDEAKFPFFDHLPTGKCRIAFRRGFIDAIDAANADVIDTSGFDLIPLQALHAGEKLMGEFKRFTKLRWLQYHGRDAAPAGLLEALGPDGWFKNLEELCLPYLDTPAWRRA
jgi:uncharacterized protein (TIGR02996 family)